MEKKTDFLKEINNEIVAVMKKIKKATEEGKDGVKEVNRLELSALKVFKSEVLREVKDNKEPETIETIEKVATALHKQMVKSLKILEDPKNRTLMELSAKLMPKITMITEEEIIEFLGGICWSEGVKMSEFGKMMGKMKSQFGKKLDCKMASELLREFINKF